MTIDGGEWYNYEWPRIYFFFDIVAVLLDFELSNFQWHFWYSHNFFQILQVKPTFLQSDLVWV